MYGSGLKSQGGISGTSCTAAGEAAVDLNLLAGVGDIIQIKLEHVKTAIHMKEYKILNSVYKIGAYCIPIR